MQYCTDEYTVVSERNISSNILLQDDSNAFLIGSALFKLLYLILRFHHQYTDIFLKFTLYTRFNTV